MWQATAPPYDASAVAVAFPDNSSRDHTACCTTAPCCLRHRWASSGACMCLQNCMWEITSRDQRSYPLHAQNASASSCCLLSKARQQCSSINASMPSWLVGPAVHNWRMPVRASHIVTGPQNPQLSLLQLLASLAWKHLGSEMSFLSPPEASFSAVCLRTLLSLLGCPSVTSARPHIAPHRWPNDRPALLFAATLPSPSRVLIAQVFVGQRVSNLQKKIRWMPSTMTPAKTSTATDQLPPPIHLQRLPTVFLTTVALSQFLHRVCRPVPDKLHAIPRHVLDMSPLLLSLACLQQPEPLLQQLAFSLPFFAGAPGLLADDELALE